MPSATEAPRPEARTPEPSSFRANCPILRTHQRYLLRDLQCVSQYAPLYRSRLEHQHESALRAMQHELLWQADQVQQSASASKPEGLVVVCGHCGQPTQPLSDPASADAAYSTGAHEKALEAELRTAATLRPSRIMDLPVHTPAVVIGVTYKQMKLLPQFLKEYQKEMLRLDAGGEDGSDEDVELPEMEEPEDALIVDGRGVNEEAEGKGSSTGEGDTEYPYVCSGSDALLLEDSSGRVTLQAAETSSRCWTCPCTVLRSEKFSTGMVVAVYGYLEPSGHFMVRHYAFSGLEELYTVPRVPLCLPPPPSFSSSPAMVEEEELPHSAVPCYIALVSGLNLEVEPNVQQMLQLRLLIDFLGGNSGSEGNVLRRHAQHISRVIVGGNLISLTEEMKLKKKVKLEPPDHARLKVNSKEVFCASASLMTKHADAILARMAATVPVELMPGDHDMSNAFLPQQPLHPILLPNASRYSSLRLVTNPYEFTAVGSEIARTEPNDERNASTPADGKEAEEKPQDGAGHRTTRRPTDAEVREGVHFFISAGQNVADVARQTHFATRIEVMERILDCGCACPTAPNTLWSYPFPDQDPFLFSRCPHCFVACEQPVFETSWLPVHPRERRGSSSGSLAGGPHHVSDDDSEALRGGSGASPLPVPPKGVRLVCVPSFYTSGQLVLVNVNSPVLETKTIDFSLRDMNPTSAPSKMI